MQCPRCQAENSERARFCVECGQRLEKSCPACGNLLSLGAKFCDQCGERLSEASPAAAQSAPRPAPTLAPEGERRQATVLFSDLSGYTAMNERLDPEEVRGIVGRIKAGAVRIVEGHGGIVNQFVGDEVVALFGVPLAHEDDPVRAVRAARDLHALVRALSPEVERRIGAPLRLHTGISTGLIVTGTEDRRDGTYGITGDAVNIGARLASHAASDAVLVSEETQRLIADFFQVEPLAPVELKGKSGRVTPYRVIEQTGVSSRFEAAAQRGFTTYAGREVELRTLNAALDKARTGQGQFVTVMGEPGIGKSRLLFEFRHALPREQAVVLTGHCQSYGTDTPYLPMVDALRRGLRLEEAGGADALHDHVVAAARAISPALERYLPQYLHLLSIPSEQHKIPATLQGDALRRSFEEALAAILTENARRQPMALILEDWHWADEASDAALRHLAGLVPHHPLQVVVSYRPDYERKWANPQNYTPLVLQPLGEAETAAMLRSVWKAEQLPDGLAAQIHARTGGNALFNEEVARGLLDDETVRVDDGRAVLSGEVTTLHLPDSVHAVIRARIDRLDPDSREVLRLASVIGREFTLPLLERLYAAPQRLSDALDALTQQDLIHPLRVVPEPAYLFKHALVQDVVYETLLLSQRKELHEQVGAAIEVLYPDRLEEHCEALAGHYSQSEDVEKAVEYLEKAGDKAAAVFPVRDAVRRYAAILQRLQGLGAEVDRKRKRIAVNIKLIDVGRTQPSPEFFAFLDESIRYARDLQDQAAHAQLSWARGRLLWMLGNVREGHEQLVSALGLARELNLPALIQMICVELVNVKTQMGMFSEAIDHLHLAFEIPAAQRNPGLDINARYFGSWPLSMMGKFREAMDFVSEALSQAETLRNVFLLAWSHFWLGFHGSILGDWNASLKAYGNALPHFQRMEDLLGTALCVWYRGYAHAMAGDMNSAIEDFSRGRELLDKSGSTLARTYALAWEAEARFIFGQIERALSTAEEGIEASRTGEIAFLPRLNVVHALASCCLAGQVAHALPDRIEAGIEDSLQRSARPDAAWMRFRYAEILHKKGDLDRALDQLAEAEKLFRDMEMSWWSEQALALRGRIERGEKFVWFAPYADGPPKV
jgi:class 3 adenylate cyclase/tetratricopeptide (TPR) repeat protein